MPLHSISPRAGMAGWVHDVPGCPLPVGLVDRTPCSVLSVDHDSPNVIIRDRAGNEWSLLSWQVDCGRECRVEGRAYHESHPVAVGQLFELLARGNPADGLPSSLLRFLLKRNGYDPDHPSSRVAIRPD